MDERKAYWFEQPYMPRMKSIAVAPVILEDGRLSFCVPGMMVLRGPGCGT